MDTLTGSLSEDLPVTISMIRRIERVVPSLSMPIIDSFLAQASVFCGASPGAGRIYKGSKASGKGLAIESTMELFPGVEMLVSDRISSAYIQAASVPEYSGSGENREEVRPALITPGGQHLFIAQDASTVVDNYKLINEWWRVGGKMIWDQTIGDRVIRTIRSGSFHTKGSVWIMGATHQAYYVMRYFRNEHRFVHDGMASDRFSAYSILYGPKEAARRRTKLGVRPDTSPIVSYLQGHARTMQQDKTKVSIEDLGQMISMCDELYGGVHTIERGLIYWHEWLKANAKLNGRDHVTEADVMFSWLNLPSIHSGVLKGHQGRVLQEAVRQNNPTVSSVARRMRWRTYEVEDAIDTSGIMKASARTGRIRYANPFWDIWKERARFLDMVLG